MSAIEKDKLYRFFAGQTTESEIEEIKAWVEESEQNMQQLLSERKLYDAILLTEDLDKKYKDKVSINGSRSRVLRIVRTAVSTAAAVAAIVIGTLAIRSALVNNDEIPETFNTIMVPAGQRANVILADGTSVWLNAGSKLVYPTMFNKNLREVTLEGEGFFDVAKNPEAPFRVNTEILDVRVLGTQFNLVANPSRGEFEAALMQGQIEVCGTDSDNAIVTLRPSQMTQLKDGKLVTKPIEFADQYRWKEGLYCFKNETIEDIISDLEKYYDVKIVLENRSLKETKLTGKFRISEGLDYALRVLQMSAKFTFVRDKETDTVFIR